MRPHDADQIIESIGLGGHDWCPDDIRDTYEMEALETIAGMHEEWGVHVTGYPKNIADWAELCDSPEDSITWLHDEEAAADFAVEREDDGYNTRIVRRYVTEPEDTDATD